MATFEDTFDLGHTRSIHAQLPRDLTVARLLVASSPDTAQEGRALIVEGMGLTIGRRSSRSSTGLALADSAVSRAHASVQRAGDSWFAVDDGSRNGTIVNGRRSQRAVLEHGHVLRVGETILLFQTLTVRPDERLVPQSGVLLGPSLAMERVRGQIAEVASSDIPVLILGPSGTGKELVASELHSQSGRSGAFVPVNCGALPRDLAESELFGHEAGAFTGAAKAAPGLVRAADGGTLFLDEIGELPPELQAKLLRVLATGEVRPVGSAKATHVKARIVAATHRDLERGVVDESFRGDLLARLRGWTIELPRLSERPSDILGIAHALEGGSLRLDADVAEALLLHDWPWNVRELRQVLDAAKVRAGGASLTLRHLPEPLRAPIEARKRLSSPSLPSVSMTAPVPPTLSVPRDRTPTRDDLERLLRWHKGNVSQVAAFFGKERAQIYRWLRRHELDAEAYRDDG
ncbi:MAG: sigma 54-interacting transcriptional regulator [Deltaproteobacteria bacterium]|nr:sigma 54-interacting transcriptional regulator [Deltaproteobacteria bacterium]